MPDSNIDHQNTPTSMTIRALGYLTPLLFAVVGGIIVALATSHFSQLQDLSKFQQSVIWSTWTEKTPVTNTSSTLIFDTYFKLAMILDDRSIIDWNRTGSADTECKNDRPSDCLLYPMGRRINLIRAQIGLKTLPPEEIAKFLNTNDLVTQMRKEHEDREKFLANLPPQPPSDPNLSPSATVSREWRVIYFDFNDYRILQPEVLQYVANNYKEMLSAGKSHFVQVNGYADVSGSGENRAIAEKRAQAVADDLIKNGVSAGDIILFTVERRGPTTTRDSRNWRVEVTLQ